MGCSSSSPTDESSIKKTDDQKRTEEIIKERQKYINPDGDDKKEKKEKKEKKVKDTGKEEASTPLIRDRPK